MEVFNYFKDSTAIIISIISLIVAAKSLNVAKQAVTEDRAILKINSRLVFHSHSDRALYIEIIVTNVGRRDAVLEGVLRHYEEGHTSYEVEENGITLREKNRVKFKISLHDFILSGDEGEVYALEDLTILDEENKEHEIPNSQELIKRFRENN
ncbi:hypothetical protein [Phytobacter massiliensis]|uniref:hypothetical protein n=1 Tax=Phytobacter massiliensis TaxID=1485952 RepID=UPI0005C5BE6F|nr:hypothetical protein [Phytobacter massiliensis]